MLPKGNKLPSSYYMAQSLIKNMMVQVEEFDCCVNDCILFRDSDGKNFSTNTVCPVCKEDRYKQGTKIPQKKFKYIPLSPRLKRLFGNETSSKLLQGHRHLENAANPSMMNDIHDTEMWKLNYSESGLFQGDPRGISFSLCTDGTNPFSKERVSYSMWPITLTVLNLPREVRNTAGAMFLVGIIPGRKEPHHMDPYLQLLVDEIKSLNSTEMYDAYRKEMFKVQAAIPLFVLDYPGLNKVFKCQGMEGMYNTSSYIPKAYMYICMYTCIYICTYM